MSSKIDTSKSEIDAQPWFTVKKRHMSSDSSVTTSDDSITPPVRKRQKAKTKRRKYIMSTPTDFYSSKNESSKRQRKYQPTDIVCLYLNDADPIKDEAYPSYIRFSRTKEKEKVILEVYEPLEKPVTFSDMPTLGRKQKQRLEWFSKCINKVLGTLSFDAKNKTWSGYSEKNEDIFENIYQERLKGSASVNVTYQFIDMKKRNESERNCKRTGDGFDDDTCLCMATELEYILGGFLNKVLNSHGRNALQSILVCTRFILFGLFSKHRIVNIGGGSSFSEGVTTTLFLRSGLKEDSSNIRQKATELLIKEEPTDYKHWVSDGGCNNIMNDAFFLFGECKSGEVKKQAWLHKLWHETLGGLIKSDNVYGIGIDMSRICILKLSVAGDALETFETTVSLCDETKKFLDSKFIEFIKIVLKIMQECYEPPKYLRSKKEQEEQQEQEEQKEQ